jgi:hypothetical protein
MTTLTPAYGRDYKNKQTLQDDINKNKDFILNDISSPHHGRYCSPSDFKGQTIAFRYQKLTKVIMVKL